jgi:hypothetical protein
MVRKSTARQQSFDFSDLAEDQKSYIAATSSVRYRQKKKGTWRGMPAVPPGSLLETVLSEFQKNTNIPLEIPFATFIHYVAGALIGKSVSINFQGKKMAPDFWTIVLAQSGAGKTWTEKELASGFVGIDVPLLNTGAVSAARFIGDLQAKPQSLWIRDEYFQILKSIDTPGSPMADVKEYLLRAYDGSKITRSTKKEDIVVDNPILSVLGFTALTPFIQGMNVESLTDGFAQRFAYVISRPDKLRPFYDYAIWSVDKTDWKERFETMLTGILPEYKAHASAEKEFLRMFKTLIGNVDLEESFYRRIMWRAHKYALIYHVLRGAAADEYLVEEDYGWASRLIEMQLSDAAEVLEMCNGTDIGKAIEAAEALVKKLRDAGKPITARAIVTGTRLIDSVGLARLVLQIIGVQES